MYNFAMDFKDVTRQILRSDIRGVVLSWDFVTFKISTSNVVAYIVHPSLNVSGSFGILVVFSHGQGTL